MTAVVDPVVIADDPVVVSDPIAAVPVPVPVPAPASGPSATRMRFLLLGWFVVVVAGLALVVYGFGPFFHERDQRGLMARYRTDLERAANESTGLPGVSVPTKAPDAGAPVAILEIGSIRLQQVVVEGVGASQTRVGPGHVPGTAGPGQPGNSAVVGRRTAFGGAFNALRRVHPGDQIVVTTTQGQSIYEVSSVENRTINGSSDVDSLYGPTNDDELTLVTSATWHPWNRSDAVVVHARMTSKPFAPTPQGGRTDEQTGLHGDSGTSAAVVLAMLLWGLVMGGSVALYRRLSSRTAYVLTVAPVLAATIIVGETVSRLFPAWA